MPQRSKHNSPSVKPSIIVLDSQRWHFATSGWKAKRKASLAGLEKQFSSISSMFPATQKLFILRPLLISHNQSSNSGSCNATLFFFFCLAWNTMASGFIPGIHGFPDDGSADKKPTCQRRRCRFDTWVGKIPWRRAWQHTLVFLPGKSHGQKSLVDYSPWGRKESDTLRLSSLVVYIWPAPTNLRKEKNGIYSALLLQV